MKKTIFLMLASLVLVGCGINCKDAPPRKAEYIQGGGYGMTYHFKLYDVRGDAGHTPGRCTNFEYISTDLYVDNFGTLTTDEVIWRDIQGYVLYPENQKDKIRFYVSKDKIIISGHTDEYSDNNGEEPVK